MAVSIVPFIRVLKGKGADALHLKVGEHPTLAKGSVSTPLTATPRLSREILRTLAVSFMKSEQIDACAEGKEVELSLQLRDMGEFRALVRRAKRQLRYFEVKTWLRRFLRSPFLTARETLLNGGLIHFFGYKRRFGDFTVKFG